MAAGGVAWLIWDSGSEARQLKKAREAIAAYEAQKLHEEKRAAIQPMIDKLGIVGAADAQSLGVNADQYQRLKKTATLKKELDDLPKR